MNNTFSASRYTVREGAVEDILNKLLIFKVFTSTRHVILACDTSWTFTFPSMVELLDWVSWPSYNEFTDKSSI